jgi:hypothetical protein
MKKLLTILLLLIMMQVRAQEDNFYKKPPQEISDLITAKPIPTASVNDVGDKMLLMERNPLTSVAELAEPELRIAGLRVNPDNFSQSRPNTITGLTLKDLKTMKVDSIKGLPENLRAMAVQWNPSQSKIAFVNLTRTCVDLYVVDISLLTAVKINQSPLNVLLGGTFAWLDDNLLIYKTTIPEIPKPEKPLAPKGPVIQESLGKQAASRTYQDLIKSSYDESLFEYYARCQLVINDAGVETKIGEPAIYRSFSISPDRQYLLIQTIEKPFSYMVTAYGFPHKDC